MQTTLLAGLPATRWPTDEPDAPLVVLLHAAVADRRAWDVVGRALADAGADVVAYDRRGFGEADADAGTGSHLEDLRSVLAALDRPAWLVGNSMGGELVVDLALTDPVRVCGLVLVGSLVSGPPEELWSMTPELQAFIDARRTAAGDRDALGRLQVAYWLDGPGQTEGRVRGPARELALDMVGRTLDVADEPESLVGAWSRLGEIEVPLTVVTGALDEPFTLLLAPLIAGRTGQGRSVELPGTAHLPMLDAPAALVDVLLEVLPLPARPAGS